MWVIGTAGQVRGPFPASGQTLILPLKPTQEVLGPQRKPNIQRLPAPDPLPISSLQRGHCKSPGKAEKVGSREASGEKWGAGREMERRGKSAVVRCQFFPPVGEAAPAAQMSDVPAQVSGKSFLLLAAPPSRGLERPKCPFTLP